MEQLSPLLQAKLEQQQAHQTQNNTNPFVSNPRVDIGGAKLEQLDKDTVSLSTNNTGKFDYSIDDGKISFGDKLKNFAKGLITPITAMFSSPKNFLIGAGMIAGGAALTIATGGAIAPLFVALGVTGGAIQLGTSIYKASKATTDDEAKSAWQGMGAGTSAVGMSVLGSKAALKGAGVDTKGMSFLKSTIECFKQVPSSVSKSVGAFTSGQALTNIKNVFKPKNSANSETNTEPKTETSSEPKAENNTEAKTENSTETKPDTKAEPKTEPKTEQNVEPKAETKVEAQAEQTKAPEIKETACETKAEPKAEISKSTTEPKSETSEVKSEIKEPTAEVKTEQPHATEPKANVKTAHQALDEAKAKFFEEHRNEVPTSYEERYKRIIDTYGEPRNISQRNGFQEMASSEDKYLEFMLEINKDATYKQLETAVALERLSKEDLELFNQIKSMFDTKELKYDDYSLVEFVNRYKNSRNLHEIAQGNFALEDFVNFHGEANHMNQDLRKGYDYGILQQILDEGFKQVKPTTKHKTVYREVGASDINQLYHNFMKKLLGLKKGETFTDKGYSFASYDKNSAKICSSCLKFGENPLRAKLIIDVPKGAKISNAAGVTSQNEMLFPRNAEFKVLTPYNPETGEIFVEYVLPN